MEMSAPMGPLVVHPANPRYFANSATGEPVYLTGSHTWANVQERLLPESEPFNFEQYLDFLQEHGHNFIRFWHWEHAAWSHSTEEKVIYEPSAFMRPGPGVALDDRPRFDVTRVSKGYLDRLRKRVIDARERGFYVSIMLFQGFSIEKKGGPEDGGNPWRGHPFHKDNNANGINGDPFETGNGREVHTVAILPIMDVQTEYVRQVVAAVSDLDNVLFEISNESHGGSTKWQYRMIDLIHESESGKPMLHPVGMTFQYCPISPGTNANLFDSAAEWISPNPDAPGDYDYRNNPPPADGSKVIITDTDHLWGVPPLDEVETTRKWVWKSFLRGLNPIFMDPYKQVRNGGGIDGHWDPVRNAMGFTLQWARQVNLAAMVPKVELASTSYCLAEVGREYLIYQPEGGRFNAHLESGSYEARWYDCAAGNGPEPLRVRSPNGCVRLEPPFEGDALLHLKAVS
jgi:hypothetical protein